jgi:hypothetical protein
LAIGALLASSAKGERQQDGIADLDAFVVDFVANSTDYSSSLMAEDSRRVT